MSIGAALATVATAAIVAAPAGADWSKSVRLQHGAVGPVSFSPTGRAVVGSSAPGVGLTSRPLHGRFGQTRWIKGSHSPVAQVLLPRGGRTVVIVGSDTGWAPRALVIPPGSLNRRGQHLQSIATQPPDSEDTSWSWNAAVTTRGRVVVFTSYGEGEGPGSLATLGPRGTHFHVNHRAFGAIPEGPNVSAADGTDGAYVIGSGPTIFYQRGARAFKRYPRGCSKCGFRGPEAIATQGPRALLATYNTNDVGTQPLRINPIAQGRIGPTTLLGNFASQQVYGLQAAADGTATLAWQSCDYKPKAPNGYEAYYFNCGVDAEAGTMTGSGFGTSPTVLSPGGPGVTSQARVIPDGVAVNRCVSGACTLSLAPVGANHTFSTPLPVATGVHSLVAAAGDPRGDALVVWTNAQGALYAATRDAGAATVSQPHLLSGSQIKPGSVRATFGPKGEAIVAWSHNGETSAAVYDVGSRSATAARR